MDEPNLIEDALCLGCGCACDDIEITLLGDQIQSAERACSLGRAWFEERASACIIQGESKAGRSPAGYLQATEILTSARNPLICGLSATSTCAQRLAIAIADRLNGCVDWTTRRSDAASVEAMQTVGAVSASLGEIAQRADLVIFWRCDPAATHPRHFERYSLTPTSDWLPRGRRDRTCIALGDASTATAQEADWRYSLTPGADYQAISSLRAILANIELDSSIVEQATGVTYDDWKGVAERLRRARYTAIFYSEALERQGGALLAGLTRLAQRVQQDARCVTASLGDPSNATGAQNVLTWQTGFPMAVSFAKGYPEYGPDEFTTEAQLLRGEADAALVVATEGLAGLSDAALDQLRLLPSVVLTSTSEAIDCHADVEFRVSPLGASVGDSIYRCDGMAIPLQQWTGPACPNAVETLSELASRIGAVIPRWAAGGTSDQC